ncbi:hypothetical protein ACWDUX_01690 [Streptomyces sp. NPDC003444]|uniref:Beta-lactamase-related domain-containing protein n=1 Tax=Streptomyces pyxinae TaxID=2970734 RepID=A0ABT2CN83_9ACTN|nr:hypothetical protein [Streptomyces sp. LP05-1]MCS0638885.1 hypothetical protein [Streptomyces sp. LP05-1]
MSGYLLPTESNPMTGLSAFGHAGRSGFLAFADPDHGLAFGYAMNRIISVSDDACATTLIEAVRESVA